MTDPVLHATSTLLQVSQVLSASRVPRRHVLLHAVCESGLLGRRDGRAGVGDGALEAVLVDFLQWGISIHLRDDTLPLEGGITGGEELVGGLHCNLRRRGSGRSAAQPAGGLAA